MAITNTQLDRVKAEIEYYTNELEELRQDEKFANNILKGKEQQIRKDSILADYNRYSKKLEQALTVTDGFGRDARSIMNTLGNIKDPQQVTDTLKENPEKIKVLN